MVLAEMAPFVPKLNHNFIVDYWRNHACTAPGNELVLSYRVNSANSDDLQISCTVFPLIMAPGAKTNF